ncbi:unnamed protein product [Arabis nemorensis]|uniref:Uncharacterized protein n=1 Tax=Arabis nemorensis TaxID=586526 RepID=A0A565BWD9_9BRAS|nr:unnamed protein product [Arabis nemorensis]
MESHEANGLETSAFRTISISVGIGSNSKEKCFKKLSCNMVSPCSCRVGRSSFAEANKRLQKLDRDYHHTNEKYIELQSEWYRHCAGRWYRYCDRRSNHYSRWIGYCISQSEDAVEQLQMVLDKLNTEEEAPKRGRDTSSNSKQFFLMHGCKSMTQEKMKLRLKSDNKEEYNDDMSQEKIDVQRINDKLNYLQRVIPKITSKKPIHDLLRPVKEMKKLMEKAILNGALVGNHTSQDDMKNSTSIEIKKTSTFKTKSISVGIGSNYKEKCFKKLSCNMLSSGPGLGGRSSFAEAYMRLQKLERDYQHACEKYTELRSKLYPYCVVNSKHYSRWIRYCIDKCEDVVEQLQMAIREAMIQARRLNFNGSPDQIGLASGDTSDQSRLSHSGYTRHPIRH